MGDFIVVAGSCGSSLGYGVAQQELGPFCETKGSLFLLPCALLLSDLLFLSVKQGCGNPLRMQIPAYRER